MPDIRVGLTAFLKADAGVAALVSGRVYPFGVLPQAVVYPAITHQVISGGSEYQMEGAANLGSPRIQIDAWAETPDAAIALGNAVVKALGGFRGSAGSPPVAIQGAFMVAMRDNFAEALSRSGLEVSRLSLDFNVWYEEDF